MEKFIKENGTAFSEDFHNLLIPHKTLRDAVHCDIALTQLESEIIDTHEFQRLRYIKQLGLSHLVYPSAHHTRFDHSLGTLYVAQKMVDIINKNPDPGRLIRDDSYELLLIRTCALLHDLTNIPFGHTLEDEGNLFKAEWKDDDRVKYLIGPTSTIGSTLTERVTDDFRTEVKNILSASTEEEIKKLEYPFISDIVGNTICADLLDYLRRDAYFAGLKEDYDERFLSYLFIPTEGRYKNRLVIRIWRKGEMRRDIVSELIKLLQIRYSLAEKIYFHHTKVATSAMIIRAIDSAMDDDANILFKEKALFKIGDEELIIILKKNKVSEKIISRLKQRKLYKSAYSLHYSLGSPDDPMTAAHNKFVSGCRNSRVRYCFERWLEDWIDIAEGSIAIYCPDPLMRFKATATIVEWKDKTMPLKDLIGNDLEAISVKEKLDHIKDSYKKLWKAHIFLDNDLAYDKDGRRTDIYRVTEKACTDTLEQLKYAESLEDVIHEPLDYLFQRNIECLNGKTSEMKIAVADVPKIKEAYVKRMDDIGVRWCIPPSKEVVMEIVKEITGN